MDNKIKLIILAVLVVAIIVVVILIIQNTKKANLRKALDDINVRFNDIKTIPLAFKLNKAQAMAKRTIESSEKINSYYARYNEVSKHIDQVNEMIDDMEDAYATRNFKEVRNGLASSKELLDNLQKEVANINEFLEEFSKKENDQRGISARLKEEYREIKMNIHDNMKLYSIAYAGLEKKLEKCEELFSESEEWMYANDYEKAKESLDNINSQIVIINEVKAELPDLIKDAKGVIPILYDEASRQNDLARQRGLYLAHLNIDGRLKIVNDNLNETIKVLNNADIDGVKEKLTAAKADLNDILALLEKENEDYTKAKVVFEQIQTNVENVKTLYQYVSGSYAKESERFDMNEIGSFLEKVKENIDDYSADIITLAQDVNDNSMPSSDLKAKLDIIFNKSEQDRNKLATYKQLIDKNTSDEERAKTQLIKLQVVLNEVEVKVNEYHLPSIAENYVDDLKAGRERINKIKQLLEQIPLNIEELNSTLDEAIDYIYTFYNNVNNIVGMAIMVENAIVFGNKYRSTYPAVDRDLSKAEFSYLNGEYTKALTMAISCMETLFPNEANEKILENA